MKLIYDFEAKDDLSRLTIVDGEKIIPVCNFLIKIQEGFHITTLSRWGNVKERNAREKIFQNILPNQSNPGLKETEG